MGGSVPGRVRPGSLGGRPMTKKAETQAGLFGGAAPVNPPIGTDEPEKTRIKPVPLANSGTANDTGEPKSAGLLPCPKCKRLHVAILDSKRKGWKYYFGCCLDCHFSTRDHDDFMSAITDWNEGECRKVKGE